jgi:CubicO group peptidase (beta-lactamase class C family)
MPMKPMMRCCCLAATVTALCIASTAIAQQAELSIDARIDELFADWNRDDAPGAAVAVIRDGEIVYRNAFGMADLERSVPLTPDSVFEIGSISKQFTAMCILLLENDGELGLDDDIRNYVPEMPEYEAPITIRHLLHHTSGVRDIETLIPLAGWHWFNYHSLDEQLALITRQKALNFPPNTEYLYSNSGYILLALVVERLSGKSLPEFAEERIFGPLGMEHTLFWDTPGQIVPGRALSYSPTDDGGWSDETWNLPFYGPAGVYTTVGDLALWDANFYDNRLGGGAGLIERMETVGVLESGEAIDYAAGLVVQEFDGHRSVGHGGAWLGYRAGLMRLPDLRLTVASLSNAASMNVGSGSVVRLLLADEAEAGDESPSVDFEPPDGIELSAEELAAYEGTWWNDSDGLLRTIEVRNAVLHYVRGGGSATELRPIGDAQFVMVGPSVRVDVTFDVAATERSMNVVVDGEGPLDFEPVVPLEGGALSEVAGSYWSEELERELRLRPEDGQLLAVWADGSDPTPVVPLTTELLLVPRFIPVPWFHQDTRLELVRDGSGSASGLSLSSEMVRGLSFVRRP